MLKKIRFTAAAFFMVAVTLLFLDYTGAVHAYLGWCAKIQFIPARLAVNDAIVAGLIVMTLLFGRVYCSVICPLGIFQDIVSRFKRLVTRKKNPFSYRPSRRALVILRCSMLVIFVLATVIPISAIAVLLEPYSVYGRMASQFLGPVYQLGNNVLAGFSERADSYTFYTIDVWMRSIWVLIVAILTFMVIGIFAWKSGRGYCNGVCPAGVFFGFLAKDSLMKPRIDKNNCTTCGLCAKNCKAGCINPDNMEIDYFRCVACFNCIGRCPQKAIKYAAGTMKGSTVMKKCDVSTPNAKDSAAKSQHVDNLGNDALARRGLLAGATVFALSLVTRVIGRTYEFDGGLAPLETKKRPVRKTAIIPPGADNIRNFRKRCTGCQLCVSACPNHILHPSEKLSEFLQPQISYERGYCRPECVKCSSVCPTGAIRSITTAEKSSIQIGRAVWNKDLCIVTVDEVSCDLCSRKCPTAAITRILQNADDPTSLKIPMIDPNRCTGCGACEHLCPSRPYSAIHIEGVESHRTI